MHNETENSPTEKNLVRHLQCTRMTCLAHLCDADGQLFSLLVTNDICHNYSLPHLREETGKINCKQS